MKPDQKAHRKRGAQPGNNNALKHGVYSSKFRKLDFQNLQQMTMTIDAEISALRIAAGRVFAYADSLDPSNDNMLTAWNVFTQQVKTINTLLKTKSIATGSNDDDLAKAAVEAILQVAIEKTL